MTTTANLTATAPAANPEYALAFTSAPLLVLPSQEGNPSGRPQSAFGMQEGSRAASLISAQADAPRASRNTGTALNAGPPVNALSPDPLSHLYSAPVNGEAVADHPLSSHSANAFPEYYALTVGSRSPKNRSMEESLSSASFQNSGISIPSRDSIIAAEGAVGVSANPSLKSGSTERPRVIQRTASLPKWNIETPSFQAGVAPAGIQALGGAQTWQLPVAEVVRDVQGADSAVTLQHVNPGAAREPFKAMDAGGNDVPSTWIRADANHAEAGFQDSSLGWVSVRAQAGPGGIHAALIPSSDAAGQVLGSHLAGLNAHVIHQHESLHPITLSTPDASGNSRDIGREMAQGNGADTGSGRQQQHMREDREPVPTESIAHSARTLAEEPHTVLPIQTLAAPPDPMEGHVSFVA